jgi:hypothetical protein
LARLLHFPSPHYGISAIFDTFCILAFDQELEPTMHNSSQSTGPLVCKDPSGMWQGHYRDPYGCRRGYQIPVAKSGEDARRLLAEVLDVPVESVAIQDNCP